MNKAAKDECSNLYFSNKSLVWMYDLKFNSWIFIINVSIQKKICIHCTVVKHSTRKGEINYFVPYEGLNWFYTIPRGAQRCFWVLEVLWDPQGGQGGK